MNRQLGKFCSAMATAVVWGLATTFGLAVAVAAGFGAGAGLVATCRGTAVGESLAIVAVGESVLLALVSAQPAIASSGPQQVHRSRPSTTTDHARSHGRR